MNKKLSFKGFDVDHDPFSAEHFEQSNTSLLFEISELEYEKALTQAALNGNLVINIPQDIVN